jgi:hypothetical protein
MVTDSYLVIYIQHNGVLNVKENAILFTSCLHKLTAPSSHSLLTLGWKQLVYTTCRCPPASLKFNTTHKVQPKQINVWEQDAENTLIA